MNLLFTQLIVSLNLLLALLTAQANRIPERPYLFGAPASWNSLVTSFLITKPTSTVLFSIQGSGLTLNSVQIGSSSVIESPPRKIPAETFSLGSALSPSTSGTYSYKIVVSNSTNVASTTGNLIIP